MDLYPKALAAAYVPDNPVYLGIAAARQAYIVANSAGFDQLSIFGDTAIGQMSMILTGSTDYGPICTCFGVSDTQLLEQAGGIPPVPTAPCAGSGFYYFDPLVIEMLAGILIDPNNQPSPNWATALQTAIDACYTLANPGSTKIYDVYVHRSRPQRILSTSVV